MNNVGNGFHEIILSLIITLLGHRVRLFYISMLAAHFLDILYDGVDSD